MRAGESSHRPFLLCLNDPRINGSRLLLPSVFIILIHYIWFSALAFCGASNAYQRRYPHDQNISVNRFLRSFLLNPVLPRSHSSSSHRRRFPVHSLVYYQPLSDQSVSSVLSAVRFWFASSQSPSSLSHPLPVHSPFFARSVKIRLISVISGKVFGHPDHTRLRPIADVSSTFFFFIPAALRSVKIRLISVISGKVLVCLITIRLHPCRTRFQSILLSLHDQ
jgi:hypothetical protein